jgi:hypothetical protein
MNKYTNAFETHLNLSIDTQQRIEKLVSEFQYATVGKSFDKELNFGILLPLFYFLRMNTIDCHLSSGIINQEKHLWIEIKNEPHLVISPYLSAIEKERQIYVGPLKFDVQISQGCQFNADFATAFIAWRTAIQGTTKTYSVNEDQQMRFKTLNENIASFLKNSQSELDQTNRVGSSKIYRRYVEVCHEQLC